MMSNIWPWILSLFVKRYEVTVWFEGDTVLESDGTRSTNRKPKTYHCRKVVKLSPKHIKLVDTDYNKIEIKTVHPVGYDVVEKKYTKPS